MRLPRLNRVTVRHACLTVSMAALFVMVSASTAAAKSPKPQSGGLLSPFNVPSSEGVPLDHYSLVADPGGLTDFQDKALAYTMTGLFNLVRVIIGVICWLIEWAYRFPIVGAMTSQAQKIADGYNEHVVETLGLPAFLLAWAFVFGLIMVMRGKVGRGFGELLLTLLIAALASSALIRPDAVLGRDGPLQQSHRAALEVGAITASGGKPAPAAPSPQDISKPVRDTLTRVFVVEPYQLLQFGEILDRKSKAYGVYKKSLKLGPVNLKDKGDGNRNVCMTVGDGCDEKTQPSKEDCTELFGKDDSYCKGADNPASWQNLAKHLADADGKDLAEYMRTPTWDRVLGALLLLVAVVATAAMGLAMVIAHLAAQFICVCATTVVYLVFAWALLPGPSRQVLWKWTGVFISAVLIMFTVSIFIPLYGIGVEAILRDNDDGLLVTRLLLVDAAAIAALGFHRRLLSAANTVGRRFADRMRWARIGGTHMHGDDAARTGLAMSSALAPYLAGHSGGGVSTALLGGGLTSGGLIGGSPQHAALLRKSKMASSLQALADPTGKPFDVGGLLGDARAGFREGLAPISLPLRAAQQLLIGNPLAPEKLEKLQKPVGGEGPMVVSEDGEVLHDPSQETTPVGTLLHNQLVKTRGGRVLLRSSKLAWNSTVGLPATWTRARRGTSDLQQKWQQQLAHYRKADAAYTQDWRAGARDMAFPARKAAEFGTWAQVQAEVYGPDLVQSARRRARDTAMSATLLTSATSVGDAGSPRETRSSQPPDPQSDARHRILEALMRAQRTTWEETPYWAHRLGENAGRESGPLRPRRDPPPRGGDEG